MAKKTNKSISLLEELPTETQEMFKTAATSAKKAKRVVKALSNLRDDIDFGKLEKRVLRLAVKIKKDKEGAKYLNVLRKPDIKKLADIEQKYIDNQRRLLQVSREVATFKKDVYAYVRQLRYWMRKHPSTPEKWSSIAKEDQYWDEIFFPVTEFFEDVVHLERACEDTNESQKQVGFMLSNLSRIITVLNSSPILG